MASRYVVVDLKGSRLGEGWRSCELEMDAGADWSDERLRLGAAVHYAVPIEQVGRVTTEPRTGEEAVEQAAAGLDGSSADSRVVSSSPAEPSAGEDQREHPNPVVREIARQRDEAVRRAEVAERERDKWQAMAVREREMVAGDAYQAIKDRITDELDQHAGASAALSVAVALCAASDERAKAAERERDDLVADRDRLRARTHEVQEAESKRRASLESEVARFRNSCAAAREAVKHVRADWTTDPPSQEDYGLWRYTSQNTRDALAFLAGERDEALRHKAAFASAAIEQQYRADEAERALRWIAEYGTRDGDLKDGWAEAMRNIALNRLEWVRRGSGEPVDA